MAAGPAAVSQPAIRTGAGGAIIRFEYTGETSMTVIGPATGLRYHFAGRGVQLRVDPRDRPHMLGVPRLRQV